LNDAAQCSGWWARHAAEAATGFKEKSGWLVFRLIRIDSGCAAEKRDWLGKESINHLSIPQAAADSVGKRWRLHAGNSPAEASRKRFRGTVVMSMWVAVHEAVWRRPRGSRALYVWTKSCQVP